MSLISNGKVNLSIKRSVLSWNIEGAGARHFRIKPGSFTVGRIKPNDVIVKHESVSRRHARLVLEGNVLYVEDLASTRGTWIGNRRLKPYVKTPLKPDESIWLGDVELKYAYVQAVGIPLYSIGGAVGFVILFAALLTWFLNRPAKSVTFACAAPSILITLPPPAAPLPTPVPTQALQETGEVTEPEATQGPSFPEPVVSDPHFFLDLPIPYNGTNDCGPGTDEQFLKASQRSSQGGRINSFFDHQSPSYTNELPEFKDSMVLFTGEYSLKDWYSGHPGYDYSPTEHNQPTTPICAPADGIIEKVYVDPDPSQKENHIIILKHDVAGVGEFKTLYFHLYQDALFDEMKTREGQTVHRYERIATMGNTGPSTGMHLHFQVKFLINGQYYSVDPYGYFPSTVYPSDPYSKPDNYLWIHPFPQTQYEFQSTGSTAPAQPEGVGGEALPQAIAAYPELCSPPDAVPAGGKLFFSISLSPPPAKDLVSIAKAITFAVQDSVGNPLSQFEKPIQITIPYTEADLENIKPGSLEIRRLNEEKNEWDFVGRSADRVHNIAGDSNITQPGQYALFGLPIEDRVPPDTTITASGDKDPNGYWCGPVKVSIASQDDKNSISELQYSLRDNTGWITLADYKPVSYDLQPEGKPEQLSSSDETEGSYPSGIGRYLVQAFAKDNKGNIEVPSSVLYIVIDPTIPKDRCVPTTLSSVNSP